MTGADLHVLHWIVRHRFHAGNVFANWVLDITSSRPVAAVLLIACATYVVVARRWRLAVAIVAAVVVSYAVSLLLKELFSVQRPAPSMARVYATGWSFPSTDSAITAAGAAALYLGATWVAAPARRRLAWALGIFVAVIGMLVVYLGVHWPTDVLAGWVLGGGTGAVAVALTRRWAGGDRRASAA